MSFRVVPAPDFLPGLGELLLTSIAQWPDAVLGVAGGMTTYRGLDELRSLAIARNVSLRQLRLMPVEVVLGMAPDHPLAFRSLVKRFLQPGTDLPDEAIQVIEDPALDGAQLVEAFTQRLASLGGLKIALLGVGTNGHVAAIEPASRLPLDPYVSSLTDETMAHAPPELAAFGREVVTVGMADLFRAQTVIVGAAGANKAAAIARLQAAQLDPFCPVSVLAAHPGLQLLLDRQASGQDDRVTTPA